MIQGQQSHYLKKILVLIYFAKNVAIVICSTVRPLINSSGSKLKQKMRLRLTFKGARVRITKKRTLKNEIVIIFGLIKNR